MFNGKLIRAKDPKAQKTLAERIKALDVDVLCVQEVENLDALEDFVKFFRLNDEGLEHLSLVEGNDKRLIDVGVISKLPLGAVSSWRHRTHPDDPAETVFSRDLLQVEILEPKDRQPVLTVYVNHHKSQLADDEEEKRKNDRRRKRQAESIASIIEENPPGTPYLVVGDMKTPRTRLHSARSRRKPNCSTRLPKPRSAVARIPKTTRRLPPIDPGRTATAAMGKPATSSTTRSGPAQIYATRLARPGFCDAPCVAATRATTTLPQSSSRD